MASSHADDSQLLIRCPSCDQRFKVGDDFRDKTVECGSCEHQFRIDDEVIVRARKVYPGERSGKELKRFNRVAAAAPERSERFSAIEAMRYGKVPDPAVLEPMSPQRILAGLIGASGIIFVALLFLFGNSRGGLLDGIDLVRRLMMGGFTALLGTWLLVYANPKARLKAVAVGILLSAGMLTVPFFFRTGADTGKVADSDPPTAAVKSAEAAEKSPEDQKLDELRNTIGTGPLDDEIARLKEEGSNLHALGLWMRGMDEPYRYLIMDYVLRVTKADKDTHFYPRGNGDYLLVVTGIDESLEELAKQAEALGSVEKIYPELSLAEVKVHNGNFVESSSSQLNNKQDAAFYDLNKRELESIDLKRVEMAVARLSDVEPKIYRTDISRKLVELLGDPEVEFKGALCGALMIWNEEPATANAAALAALKELLAAEKPVPREMVNLLVKGRDAGVIPVLDELWFKNPTEWEEIFGDVGPAAEATLLRRFPQAQGTIRYSLVRILGRVGGPDSLAVLKGAEIKADSELQVLLDQASQSIQTRAGRP